MADTGLWVVIVFRDDNSVAVEPNIWLLDDVDGHKSYWPQRARNPTSFVKKREVPDKTSWLQYEIKILGYYDNYDTAVKKSVTAEDTSDLSSCLESVRKRKRNTKYVRDTSSDTESEKEPDLEVQYPTFPVSLKNTQTQENEACQTSLRGKLNKATKSSPHVMVKQQNTYSPSSSHVSNHLNTSFSFSNTPTKVSSSTEFQLQAIRKLNIITARLQRFDERFDDLETLLQRTRHKDNDQEDDTGGMDIFPLKSEDDIQRFEITLEDKTKFSFVTKSLSRIGGDSPQDITKKIMCTVLTNDVGQNYSWDGGKGKNKFKELTLSRVILNAVRKNNRTANACDDEIIGAIKKWLVKAKDRYKNEVKRARVEGVDIDDNLAAAV